MVDIMTMRDELTLIVNTLARAVVTEMLTSVGKVSSCEQNPYAEEKLSALVDGLCAEAVEKILNVVQLAALKNEEVPTNQTVPPEAAEDDARTMEGGDGSAEQPPTGQTYILVYGNAPVDPKCVLLSLQRNSCENTEGGIKTETTGKVTTIPQSVHPLPSLQSHADVPDHEYARPSLAPPDAASAVDTDLSKSGGRKWQQRKRKKVISASQTEAATETLFQCAQCGMLSVNEERLSDHQRKSHPVCSVCGKTLNGILKLHEHEIKEHGLLPYACSYCPKRFKHKPHLNLHEKARHTGEKTCHCDICGKGYSSTSMLKTHKMTHFKKKFTCDVCGKSFYHSCHLTRHKLVHQEVRPHKCPTCGKGFTQAANLRSHQLTHSGEKELCSICGKSYRCLKYHVISKHSDEFPSNELPPKDTIITCDVCGKKFPNLSQFKVHQRIHTGEKPFDCDICGKSYRLKELLRDHKYTHTGEKPYRCNLCPKTFNLAPSLLRHRSIHTGETPFSCLDCGKHFRLLTFLKAHLQTKAHLKRLQRKQSSTSEPEVTVALK